MTNQHGRRFELDLFNGVNDITTEEVWVTTAGFSGNARGDGCDMVITLDPKLMTSNEPQQINCEVKKRQGEGGKRVSNVFSGSETDETGVEELKRLVMTTPSWGDPIVALKFDHRKLIVLDARWILDAIDAGEHYVPIEIEEGILEVLSPRTTPSGNVSMIKPSLEAFESSRAAPADEEVLAERLGLPYETNK